MLNDFESGFWRDTRYAIPAISSDVPVQTVITTGESWIFLAHLNDPWLNIGYANTTEDLQQLSGETSSAGVPGVAYGRSTMPMQDIESGRFLRYSTMQLHRFGIDTGKDWAQRIPEAAVKKAKVLSQIHDSNKVQVETFGLDPGLMAQVAGPKLLADRRVSVYNLTREGDCVSTLTLYHGEINGLPIAQMWSMATLPSEQGKGFGTHLFGQVLTDLSTSGIYGIALMASPEGKRLYDRLGFIDIAQNPIYALNSQPEK